MTDSQTSRIDWRDGVPVSTRFDDPYYSLEDGLAETRHVFLDGNDLPRRFRPGFQVAELGFGTGLNFLCALDAWHSTGIEGPLRYVGFEAHPLATTDLEQALSAFPSLNARPLLDAWPDRQMKTAQVELQIVIGDARQTLPSWPGRADAWFLDGFAPARNPELWEQGLMQQVAAHTNSGGTFATYTAAGAVRRSLSAAGFRVERRPGFGRKRHMTVGQL